MKTMTGLPKFLIVGLLFVLILLPSCRYFRVSDPPVPPTTTPQEPTEIPSIIRNDETPHLPDPQPTVYVPQITGNSESTPFSNPKTSVYLPSINERDEPAPTAAPQTNETVPTITDHKEPVLPPYPQTTIYLPLMHNPPPFRFIAWGDTKTGTSVLAALSNQARAFGPAFTLYLGDLEGDGFTIAGITAWVDAINGGNGNGMAAITLPIRGNHDNLDLSGWQAYFDTAGTASLIGATNYTELEEDVSYAFDYKNAIFIALDVLGNGDMPSDIELAFLDSTLTAAEQRGLDHAFIFMHGPIYNVSKHNDCHTRTCVTDAKTASFVRVLNNHPIVSAVFNGHEHLYAYVHMDETRIPEITNPWEQFITGAAGADLYACDQDYRFDYCGFYAGFATIDVSEKNFTVRIYQQNEPEAVKTYSFTKD